MENNILNSTCKFALNKYLQNIFPKLKLFQGKLRAKKLQIYPIKHLCQPIYLNKPPLKQESLSLPLRID
jgi:hypothetical protein